MTTAMGIFRGYHRPKRVSLFRNMLMKNWACDVVIATPNEQQKGILYPFIVLRNKK